MHVSVYFIGQDNNQSLLLFQRILGISFCMLQHRVAGIVSATIYDFHGQGALEKCVRSRSPESNP